MGLFGKLFGGRSKPDTDAERCQECGKALPEHASWCPSLREEPDPEAAWEQSMEGFAGGEEGAEAPPASA